MKVVLPLSQSFSRCCKACFLVIAITAVASAYPIDDPDGHFSSWDEIPTIIDSMNETSHRKQLEQLHDLTRIKLGYPQVSVCLNEEEHLQYMLQTKQRWKQWWDSTGKPVAKQKEQFSKVDQPAFDMAWQFLGTKQKPPPQARGSEWYLLEDRQDAYPTSRQGMALARSQS